LTIPYHGIDDEDQTLQESLDRKVPSHHQNSLIHQSIDLYEKIEATFHSIKKYDRMEDPGKASKPQPADDGIATLKRKWLRSLSDDDPQKQQLQAASSGKKKPDHSNRFNVHDS